MERRWAGTVTIGNLKIRGKGRSTIAKAIARHYEVLHRRSTQLDVGLGGVYICSLWAVSPPSIRLLLLMFRLLHHFSRCEKLKLSCIEPTRHPDIAQRCLPWLYREGAVGGQRCLTLEIIRRASAHVACAGGDFTACTLQSLALLVERTGVGKTFENFLGVFQKIAPFTCPHALRPYKPPREF